VSFILEFWINFLWDSKLAISFLVFDYFFWVLSWWFREHRIDIIKRTNWRVRINFMNYFINKIWAILQKVWHLWYSDDRQSIISWLSITTFFLLIFCKSMEQVGILTYLIGIKFRARFLLDRNFFATGSSLSSHSVSKLSILLKSRVDIVFLIKCVVLHVL
jgi:hypothetical protein